MRIEEPDVLSLERQFFNGLIANVDAVEVLTSNDSLLVDVLSGSEVIKSELITVLRSGQLKFGEIESLGSRVRFYEGTALVTGSTAMSGRFGDDPFSVVSRYTHVYVRSRDRWHLVSAQGTSIKTAE